MSSAISDQYRLELLETFKSFDKDGNGFIDYKELETVLKTLKIPYTMAKLKSALSRMDRDGNGYLDFEEFISFMMMVKPKNKQLELNEIFKKIDVDNSGTIEITELKEMMKQLGQGNLSEQELQNMMFVIDENDDGVISFEEFAAFFKDMI